MSRLWRRDMALTGQSSRGPPVGPVHGAPTMATLGGPISSPVPETLLVMPTDPIFLMTSTAQTISGVFVWTALLLTCHQVTPQTHLPPGDTSDSPVTR